MNKKRGLITCKMSWIEIGYYIMITFVCIILTIVTIRAEISSRNIRGEVMENQFILNNSFWVCVAETCIDWAEGNEWIVDNCRPQGENITLYCNITVQDKTYYAPLSIVNLTNVRSCRHYECIKQVLIKEQEVKK